MEKSLEIDSRTLYQVPMESPLNMAHSFSRRADALRSSKKYEEAIHCFSKAAECMLQAMGSCDSTKLQEAMAIQQQAYLTEMDSLSRKLQLTDGNFRSTNSVSRAAQTDGMHNLDGGQPLGLDKDSVCQILRENDDMIKSCGFKNSKADSGGIIENGKGSEIDIKPCLGRNSPSNFCQTVLNMKQASPTTGSYSISDVADILDMNDRLSMCVRALVQQVCSLHAEKLEMERRLVGSQERGLQQLDTSLKLSDLDLSGADTSYPELRSFSPQL